MKELTTLAANGLGHGATTILRWGLETTVNAKFVRQFPDRCTDYIDWSHIERFRHHQYARAHVPEAWDQISPAERACARGQYERVRGRFTRRDGGIRARRCDSNLAEQAKHAGLGGYTSSSRAGNLPRMFGLLQYFESSVDLERIALPPNAAWCSRALCGGHAWVMQTVVTLSDAFGLLPDPTMQALEADSRAAWSAH